MSEPTEDDLDTLPEGELMALPEDEIPQGWLSQFFARRAAMVYQRDSIELELELSGQSSRHLMIFAEMDPNEKRRRKEEEDRRRLLAEQELEDYREHSDRLLARIEQEQIAIEKRRKEIEDNALKLHDGRRVYVDGNQYRDENGNILSGSVRDEAAELHRGNPQASTWQQKKDIDDRYAEAERLRQKVLQDRQDAERGGDITTANNKLTSDEKEFAAQVEARAAQPTTDYGSSDYMAAYGDDYQMSTVPAFTKAANQTGSQTDKATETETEQAKSAPQPFGQGGPKPG
jgi:hypothetical protein